MAKPIYIDNIYLRNVGPIESFRVTPRFSKDGLPYPIVLVGVNGSGKSTALSVVVDALLEIAGKAYQDALIPDGIGHRFYKIISSDQITHGSEYLLAHVSFSNKKSFLFKCGNLSFKESQEQIPELSTDLNWNEEVNFKTTDFTKDEAELFFQSQAICCFHPVRYEKPSWMGEGYHERNFPVAFSIKPKWSGRIVNSIVADNCISDTQQWLLDIIADSRGDIDVAPDGGLSLIHTENRKIEDILYFASARKNIEALMSSIIGQEIYFDFNYRNAGAARFSIKSSENGCCICPSLNALSTGELALFEMFSTIVRYADNLDLSKCAKLDEISGIAVIDEVDLHLHPKMQKEVLPRLMHMLPKVQFIITTHSPLLLLGLNDEYGQDGLNVYQLPECVMISPEEYVEFETAYNAFSNTNKYIKDIADAISEIGQKPLVITEGTTDWRHLKAMEEHIRNMDGCTGNPLPSFEYFEYGPKGDDRCSYEEEMGNKRLKTLCENLASVPGDSKRTVIVVADRDDPDTVKALGREPFKCHGNGVYSFVLPVPKHRKQAPEISIEQLYLDKTFKQPVIGPDGVKRRLFTSDEFDKHGRPFAIEGKIAEGHFSCKDHIMVVDGGNAKVLDVKAGSSTNYALSKTAFANAVLDGEIKITKEDIESFLPVFETIGRIISDSRNLV